MASIVGLSLSSPAILAKATVDPPKLQWVNQPLKMIRSKTCGSGSRMLHVHPVAAIPDKLSEKVAESVKAAQETCSDDPVSGECVAAWDEVEELSAAASHARDKKKESDPLEDFCKDNMDTVECRTYED